MLIEQEDGREMLFQIKAEKKETMNKTVRFPSALVQDIEDAIGDTNVSFSGFVIQACEYALDHMEK